MDYTIHGTLQARILESVAFPFSRGSSQSRDQTQISHIAGTFFTSSAIREAPGILEWLRLSLLQRIFPTQESNWGLLHCRQILYQLSYQSPAFLSPVGCYCSLGGGVWWGVCFPLPTSCFMWLDLTREMWAICHFQTAALRATDNSLFLGTFSKNPLKWSAYVGQGV